jgi:hypothetical protein
MTTIVRFLPQWLRGRSQKSASRSVKTISKKDRQVLPMLPQQSRPSSPWQDDHSPPGYRIQWRL